MPNARLDVTMSAPTPIRRIVSLNKPHFTIGRRDINDLQVRHDKVSRFHAEILTTEVASVLRDRDSHYGTFVNGQRINEHALIPGDRIQLGPGGETTLVFLTDESPDQV